MLAAFVSILLHAALALALGRVAWDAPDPPDDPPHIVWLRTPVPEREPREPDPPPTLEPEREPREPSPSAEPEREQREPQVDTTDEPRPEPPDDPEAQPADEPVLADEPTPDPTEDSADGPAASDDRADEDADDAAPGDDAVVSAEREGPPTAVDLYEEGRASAAALIDELVVEERHHRFSSDFFDEPAAEAPNPREDMFEPGAGGKPSRSFMQPGSARTRVGRWLADTCNALSGGGIGLAFMGLNIGTLCAEDSARSDLFADIKPEYLKSLPVCEEVRLESPAPGGEGLSVIKCRLVPQE